MKCNELKMGDEVEVLKSKGVWERRIFIKHGDSGIIAVQQGYEDKYNEGLSFNTQRYDDNDWRFPKEISYRPFTWEERDQLRGKWVKYKDSKDSFTEMLESQIHSFFRIDKKDDDFDWIFLAKGYGVSPKNLLNKFVFIDGTPCGVKVG